MPLELQLYRHLVDGLRGHGAVVDEVVREEVVLRLVALLVAVILRGAVSADDRKVQIVLRLRRFMS